ncbi:MAG: YMGG-like glycine zipper-containing protein [Erythrobacter sp.]
MTFRSAIRAVTGMALVVSSPALVNAQTVSGAIGAPAPGTVISDVELQTLPSDLQTAPLPVSPVTAGDLVNETTETIVGEDGVETIVRTRYIRRGANAVAGHGAVGTIPEHQSGAWHQAVAQPVVFEREQWLDECRRRTRGADNDEKGGIIGGLLGAIAGGIIGNRVSDGERLAGTLIGAGTGGLAGLAIGTLLGRGSDDDRYDCEAALDNYLSQNTTVHGSQIGHTAVLPAGRFAQAGSFYGHNGCGCVQQQQVTLVPVRVEQQQQVIVRERVREELIPAPPRERIIPPSPKLVPQTRQVVPVPQPVTPVPIKTSGN